MKYNKLISEVPYNVQAKDQLFELFEDNDELMLEVLETILDISEKDKNFREKVLDKVFATNYLARRVEAEMHQEDHTHEGCIMHLIAK